MEWTGTLQDHESKALNPTSQRWKYSVSPCLSFPPFFHPAWGRQPWVTNLSAEPTQGQLDSGSSPILEARGDGNGHDSAGFDPGYVILEKQGKVKKIYLPFVIQKQHAAQGHLSHMTSKRFVDDSFVPPDSLQWPGKWLAGLINENKVLITKSQWIWGLLQLSYCHSPSPT